MYSLQNEHCSFFPQVEHVRAAEDAAQNVPGGTVETKKEKFSILFHIPFTWNACVVAFTFFTVLSRLASHLQFYNHLSCGWLL